MSYPQNRLPEWFEKEYVELLYDHRSDETKKARRNLTVGSFLVVGVYVVGISLTEMKFIGADLSQGNALRIVSLAIALIIYLFIGFAVYSLRDWGLRQERRRRVDDAIDRLEKEHARETKVRREHPSQLRPHLEAVEKELGILQGVIKRTKIPRRAVVIASILEYLIPPVLGIAALAFLGHDLYWRL